MAAARSIKFTADGIDQAADQADQICGMSYPTGFTAVTVYDGHDNTGNVVLAGGAGPVTISLAVPVTCEGGVFVDVAGTGSGSIFI